MILHAGGAQRGRWRGSGGPVCAVVAAKGRCYGLAGWAGWRCLFHNGHGAVVVAVIAMGVMQAAIDDVVGVIAVGHGLVAAAGAVGVLFAGDGFAGVGVGGGDFKGVFIDMIAVDMMEVAVMEVIDVVAVLDGGVAAVGAVLVGVVFVNDAGHGKPFRKKDGDVGRGAGRCQQHNVTASDGSSIDSLMRENNAKDMDS